MAVYKATHCYPLANSIDIRVVADQQTLAPCVWLKCQVDTSNKQVTGYKIRILDTLNRQVFPVNDNEYVSPISELENIFDTDSSTVSTYINSGLNGSNLHIPFFQNANYSSSFETNNTKLCSYNAVYYLPRYSADYVVEDLEEEGWTGNISSQDYITNAAWDGTFQNEFMMKMDTILCLSGVYQGMWQVREDGVLIKYRDINGNFINGDYLKNQYCTITKGSSHNYVYKFNSSAVYEEYSTPEKPSLTSLWVDINQNEVKFAMDGSTYKWEITLYQGNGEIVHGSEVTLIGPVDKIDYSNLSFEWFDSVLTSGTILGSTTKRIQISDDNEKLLPESDSAFPIVLQGKYVQLYRGTIDNPVMLGSRAYIQSYDATYAHIYPMTGIITADMINSATYVRCQQYTNDPDYILSSDKVTVATRANITDFYIQDGSSWKVNPAIGLPVIDGIALKQGDMVLVKDQINAKENGVYIAQQEGVSWVRSGSYRTWGDFLGKVIYVENGVVNKCKNFQSSAQTFGAIYYPEQGDEGDSPLYFVEEKPINLFPSKLTAVSDYIYIGNNVPGPGSLIADYDLDGYTVVEPMIGQVFVAPLLKKIYKITAVTATTFDAEETAELNSNDVVSVSYGRMYAGSNIVIPESGTIISLDNSIATAKILKNSANKTYISPYINLNADMGLRLQNHLKIYYKKNNVLLPTEWIRINSINKVLWSITHGDIYDSMGNQIVLLSMSELDLAVPYTYDVCTYYKASDENPFYLYEKPYLKIICHEDDYSFSDVIFDNEHNIKEIRKRYIDVTGEYYQFQRTSWESYRWTLKNSNGEIIQDTGNKYDKLIKTSFYGLSNDIDNNSNRYTIELSVIDDIGNTLNLSTIAVVKPHLVVVQGTLVDNVTFVDTEGHTIEHPSINEVYYDISSHNYYMYDVNEEEYIFSSRSLEFTANFDCSSHSVILNYQDNVFVIPSEEYQAIDRAVVPDGSTYFISNEQMYVNDHNDGDTFVLRNRTINDSVSDNLPITNISPLVTDNFGLSERVQEGIEYSHYYLAEQSNNPLNYNLSENDQRLIIKDDVAYVESEVILSANYCGDIFTFTVDSDVDGEELAVTIATSENFTDGVYTQDHLNQNRDKFIVRYDYISIRDPKTGQSVVDPGFSIFTKSNNKYRYIIQPQENADLDYEYHEFTDNGSLFYFKKIENNQLVGIYNSEKSLGQCCLESSSNNTESMYWYEDECNGTLTYVTEHFASGSGINLLANNNKPEWPSDADEVNFYWSEEEHNTYYPAVISVLINNPAIVTASQYFHKYYAMPRHPLLNNETRKFRFSICIDNISNFCVAARDAALSFESTVSDNVITIKCMRELVELGTILIKKIV